MRITSVFFRFRRGLRDVGLLVVAGLAGILIGQAAAPKWNDRVTALVLGLGLAAIGLIAAAMVGDRQAPKQPTLQDVMDRFDDLESKIESNPFVTSASIGSAGPGGGGGGFTVLHPDKDKGSDESN